MYKLWKVIVIETAFGRRWKIEWIGFFVVLKFPTPGQTNESMMNSYSCYVFAIKKVDTFYGILKTKLMKNWGTRVWEFGSLVQIQCRNAKLGFDWEGTHHGWMVLSKTRIDENRVMGNSMERLFYHYHWTMDVLNTAQVHVTITKKICFFFPF